MWAAADQSGTYGALIKMLILTGQRLDKVQTMMWADLIDGKATWKIRTESTREKAHGGTLRLPKLAQSILAELPRFAKNPYVFAGRVGHINGMSKSKARFDKIAGVADWTLHDLRRTARTLMPRVGVSADIAERVLGHAIAGNSRNLRPARLHRREGGRASAPRRSGCRYRQARPEARGEAGIRS